MNKFSHIYIEKQAFDYPLTQDILDRFPESVKIEIDRYKDVFCRPGQDFQLQKTAQKLILAVKRDNFLYKGAGVCQSFGNENFFYTSSLLNCIYNCDYCYLQGMYQSSNLVAFVNIGDFFEEVLKELSLHPVYLTVSYDTDLLALESIIPFASKWISFTADNPTLLVELRTKSANYGSISNIPSPGNVILAWTLSPEAVADKYERNAPSLEARLSAAKRAANDGWKVRLCFDPVVLIEGWEEQYCSFIDRVFSVLPPETVYDASVGAFRMSSEYLKRIRKSRTDSDLIHYPFQCSEGVEGYPSETEKMLIEKVYNCILKYMDKERIFL